MVEVFHTLDCHGGDGERSGVLVEEDISSQAGRIDMVGRVAEGCDNLPGPWLGLVEGVAELLESQFISQTRTLVQSVRLKWGVYG